MEVNGDAGRHEDVHEMSTAELDELFGFAEDPEFLRACLRGRSAFSDAVVENAARRSAEMRRPRLDQSERGLAGRQRGPRARLEVRLAVAELVDVGVKRGARVTGTRRTKLVGNLRKQYEQGASIRALAEATGRSYGFIHRILSEAGVELRGRGGVTRSKKET